MSASGVKRTCRLDRNRDAIQWQHKIAGRAKRTRFGQHVIFRSQADEDSGIAVRADAGKHARGSLFWRYCPNSMRCHNRGDGLNQNNPRIQSDKRPGALFFVRKFLSPRNTQNRCVILILSNHNVRFGVCSHGPEHWTGWRPRGRHRTSLRPHFPKFGNISNCDNVGRWWLNGEM